MVLIPKAAYDRWAISKDNSNGINLQEQEEDHIESDVQSQVKDKINDSNGHVVDEGNNNVKLATSDDTDNNVKVTSSDRALPRKTASEISSNIIDKFPYKYKLYAKRLLAFIKKNGAGIVEWNDDGTFLYRGSPVEGSNITELIIHLFKTNRAAPKGVKQFRKGLDKIRVPKAFIKPYLLKPPGTPDNIKKKWVQY